MPQLKRKDFAQLVGRTVLAINLDYSRGKLSTVPGNEKLMDTDNPLNRAYIVKWTSEAPAPVAKPAPITKAKKAIKDAGVKLEIEKKAPEKPKIATEPREIKEKILRQSVRDQRRVDQDVLKRDREIEQIELNIQHKELLLQKSAGKLLPVDLIAGVITRHTTAIIKNFDKGFEQLADKFVAILAGGNPERRAEVIDSCKRVLAKCVADAGEDAQIEIDTLITDYSEALMRGQKKV